MARPGITRDEVFNAATALQEEGIAPTVQTVRDRLGSGSYSTISSHLAAWKAENTAQAAADIPPVPDKVEAAFKTLWAAASRSAQQSVEADRQVLEAMRRELDKERHEMRAEIRNLEDALEIATAKQEQCAEQLMAVQEESASKDEELMNFRLEITRLTERTSGVESQLVAMEKERNRERDHREQAEKHQAELATMNARLEEQLKLTTKD